MVRSESGDDSVQGVQTATDGSSAVGTAPRVAWGIHPAATKENNFDAPRFARHQKSVARSVRRSRLPTTHRRAMTDSAVHRLTDPQRAALLRRRVHKAVADNNRDATNTALKELYDTKRGPLVVGGVNRPETFAPMVEAVGIAVIMQHDDLADEMWDNVRHLWKGYNLTRKDFNAITDAMEACDTLRDLQRADTTVSDCLRDTALDGRVKLARHAPRR